MTAQSSTLNSVFNYLEVAANCSGNVVVKVLDIQGRIAKTVRQTLEESIDKFCLDVDDLRKGKYIINVFNDNNFIKAIRYTKN